MKNDIWAAGLGAVLCAAAGNAAAEYRYTAPGGQTLTFSGYLREHLSMNLDSHPERKANGDRLDGQWELSMARTSALVQVRSDLGWGRTTVIWRGVREIKTGFLDDLDDNPAQNGDLMDRYNDSEFREWYLDFTTGRIDWRLGRQQVVWGETDLFQALDLVHGYDYTWRSLIEPENEELRKPLIMVNSTIRIPELGGDLQLLFRPGWDDKEDIGTSVDLFGGRWAAQPNKGVNVLAAAPLNLDHHSGDKDDPSYGFRWRSAIGPVSYTLNYLRTFNDNPVINSALAPYGGQAPAGLAELIYPEIDVLGASANIYNAPLDVVFRLEAAFTPNKPYNVGYVGSPIFNAFGGAVPAGFFGVKEKDTAKLMLGIDKPNLQTQRLLGTFQPSFLTFQLFDSWITNFDDDDQLVDVTSKLHEHSVVMSLGLNLNYRYDTVQPTLLFAWDATNGGGALLPSVNFIYGNHWRVRVGASIFVTDTGQQNCSTSAVTGKGAECTHLFGTFANNDQLDVRLTYQF